MPRGRGNVPSTAKDGIWFQHRGLPAPEPLRRDVATCTGRMLSAPYNADAARYPPTPPTPYRNKDTRSFKNANNFSKHDNRHSIQDSGVYFGDGRSTRHFGKNHVEPFLRQHHTETGFLEHRDRHAVLYDYNTINASDYQGKPISDPPKHRRYLQNHLEGEPGLAKLSTETTMWQEHSAPVPAYRTPLHVLAITQEPLLPKNSWKYSNHGLPKCYPRYDRASQEKGPYAVWKLNAPNMASANLTLKAMAIKD